MSEREFRKGDDEMLREQWIQKITEAFNAAEDTFNAVQKVSGKDAAWDAFESTWKSKCGALKLGDVVLQWKQGVFAVTGPQGGQNYIFVQGSRVALDSPITRMCFDVAPSAQQGAARVKQPASIRSAIYDAINGDIQAADEHEFEKGLLV